MPSVLIVLYLIYIWTTERPANHLIKTMSTFEKQNTISETCSIFFLCPREYEPSSLLYERTQKLRASSNADNHQFSRLFSWLDEMNEFLGDV